MKTPVAAGRHSSDLLPRSARLILLCVCLLALWLVSGSTDLQAQGRAGGGRPGAGDPARTGRRTTERLREQMEVSDDAEWQVIAARIDKVNEARRALGTSSLAGGPGGSGGPGGIGLPGGPGGPGGNRSSRATSGRRSEDGARSADGGGGRRSRTESGNRRTQDRTDRAGEVPGGAGVRGGPGGMERATDPDLEALRKAIAAKAPAAELKTLMVRYRTSREAKETALERAREELRQVLSVRQEAVALAQGLLK